MIYKITVKTSKNSNGIRIERGMSVEVVTNNITNPVTTNGGQAVVDALCVFTASTSARSAR